MSTAWTLASLSAEGKLIGSGRSSAWAAGAAGRPAADERAGVTGKAREAGSNVCEGEPDVQPAAAMEVARSITQTFHNRRMTYTPGTLPLALPGCALSWCVNLERLYHL